MKNEIPGWMTEEELAGINAIADTLKPESWVLEIGSFLGRSAVQWAAHKNVSRVVCVDAWMGMPRDYGYALDACDYREKIVLDLPILDQFVLNTFQIKEIYPVRYYSQEFVWRFNKKPSVIFIDGDHSETGLAHDLNRAFSNDWGYMPGKTIIAGHDYDHSHIPHIKPMVDAFAYERGLGAPRVMGGMVFALGMPKPAAPVAPVASTTTTESES